MAKKVKKQKGKSEAPRRNFSPLTLLRPRLDGLINNPGWIDRQDAEIVADLEAIVRHIEAADYLPILLRSVHSAPDLVQERLNQLIPGWIESHYETATLLALLEEENIQDEDVDLAKAWLTEMGVDQEQLNQERDSTFCDAYFGIDGFPSQGFIIIMWYANRNRSRVQGFNFLLDFNPPWEGSIKDGYTLPQRSHRDAVREFVDIWQGRPLTVTQIDGATAKAKFIEALQRNQAEEIRIHRDIANESDKIIKHILSLPDLPDAPPLTVADFNRLCNRGQRAEQLMFNEQNFGRRVRMDDGQEVVILGNPWDDDDPF